MYIFYLLYLLGMICCKVVSEVEGVSDLYEK